MCPVWLPLNFSRLIGNLLEAGEHELRESADDFDDGAELSYAPTTFEPSTDDVVPAKDFSVISVEWGQMITSSFRNTEPVMVIWPFHGRAALWLTSLEATGRCRYLSVLVKEILCRNPHQVFLK